MGHGQCRIQQFLSHWRTERRAGSYFNELLVATLQAAFPFPDMADLAGAVADHLYFDVPCLFDQALHVKPIVTEGCHGFPGTGGISRFNVIAGADNTHTTTATTGNGLDDDGGVGTLGIRKRFGLNQRGLGAGTGHHRHLAALGQVPCRRLFTQQGQRLR